MEQVKVVSHCSQPLLRCRRLLPEHMRIKMRWSHCLITEELETGPFSTWFSPKSRAAERLVQKMKLVSFFVQAAIIEYQTLSSL